VTARFYFSFRSPYSWLAYRDLTARHGDLAARLSLVPFWEPDEQFRVALAAAGGRFPYADMSRAKALYILQDVRRLASARDIQLAWPTDRRPWWEVSHLAYLVAAREGYGPAFIEGVYGARWMEGLDISQPATIARIASALGLDPAPYVGAAADPAIRAEGLRVLLDIESDGVFGVPFFVHGHQRYWGLDRLDQFAAALRAAGPLSGWAAEGGLPVEMTEPGADQGHEGGCG
jgi:2-hydroxychromene-2-carboxylate isomerase